MTRFRIVLAHLLALIFLIYSTQVLIPPLICLAVIAYLVWPIVKEVF